MKKAVVLAILCYVFIFLNCRKEYDSLLFSHPDEKVMVYFNSFETENNIDQERTGQKDTTTFTAAPSCGEQSCHITGGCLQPAVQFHIVTTVRGHYEMGVWARLADVKQPGQVVFRNCEGSQISTIALTDSSWSYYFSDALRQIDTGDTLWIEFLIGGFIPAEMWIDCLTVEAIPD